jgi:hypothetical protein
MTSMGRFWIPLKRFGAPRFLNLDEEIALVQ